MGRTRSLTGGLSLALLTAAATGSLLAAGCSLSRFDQTPCSGHAQCRDQFGFGATCGSEGLCQPATSTLRCATTYPDDLFSRRERYRDAVVLGSLMDQSSAAHVVREKAVRLAAKEVAAVGNLDGRVVGVVFCNIAEKSELDTLTRTNAAVASARYLSDTLGVAAIVGPSASADAQQVWDAVRTIGTPVISPAATSPALGALEPMSSDEKPGLLWRVAPPDSLQGKVIADDMLARNVSQVFVIREAGAYGEGLANVFLESFTKGGGQAQVSSISADSQIGEASAAGAADAATEVLFISSQQDWVIRFLNAAGGQAGYGAKNIFLTDAAANLTVLSGANAATMLFPRIRGTRPAPRDPSEYVYASFVANYKAEYGGEDPAATTFSAHSYDSTWLALYGSAWSMVKESAITGEGIGRGLRRVSEGTPTNIIPSSFPGAVTAYKDGRLVNLSGASGELNFDPVTRDTTAPVEIWAVSTAGGMPAIIPAAVR